MQITSSPLSNILEESSQPVPHVQASLQTTEAVQSPEEIDMAKRRQALKLAREELALQQEEADLKRDQLRMRRVMEHLDWDECALMDQQSSQAALELGERARELTEQTGELVTPAMIR